MQNVGKIFKIRVDKSPYSMVSGINLRMYTVIPPMEPATMLLERITVCAVDSLVKMKENA